jgi:hypothetical protein
MVTAIVASRAKRSPEAAPSNLTGANRFAGQDHCSRVCGAQHRRAAGAPLTGILNGKRIVGTVGRATRIDQTKRGAGDRVTASSHILREAGRAARRRPPCPSAPPRERARLSRRPGRERAPAIPR